MLIIHWHIHRPCLAHHGTQGMSTSVLRVSRCGCCTDVNRGRMSAQLMCSLTVRMLQTFVSCTFWLTESRARAHCRIVLLYRVASRGLSVRTRGSGGMEFECLCGFPGRPVAVIGSRGSSQLARLCEHRFGLPRSHPSTMCVTLCRPQSKRARGGVSEHNAQPHTAGFRRCIGHRVRLNCHLP